ncbi:MAG: fumarate reductase subunit C [Motiliproteus sp.]
MRSSSTEAGTATPKSHRKPYVQQQPASWWLKNRFYRFYMLREATSVPIYLYALVLMWGIYALSRGEAAFADWLAVMQTPAMMAFHLLVLAASLLHAYTWFDLTPKILVIRLGAFRVPDLWVKLAHYGGFVVTSAAVLLLAVLFLNGGSL